MQGRILQINISKGGIPKTAIPGGIVGPLGIEGDLHAHPQYHGGPKKALLLIASELIASLKQEGWPLFYGALGENLTTIGLDHTQWRTGLRFRVAEVVIELTTPRQPCATLNPYGRGIQRRIFDSRVKAGDASSPYWGMSGFYASVLEGGSVAVNDIIQAVTEK